MGISSVGSFPVWSGGSLIIFQLLRCRNLALNRVSSYFLVAGMFLYLGGCLDSPTFIHPPYICMTPYICMPSGMYTPSICPHTLLCLCVFLEAFHVVGGCNGLPFVLGHPLLHHPCLGMHLLNCTPHTQLLVPCASVCFRDICMLCGHFPSC